MELLQNKLRPNKLNDVLGQNHLIGKDKILSNLVKNKKIFNMILYGKSGIGKTTIALALVNELGLRYRSLNATINNKKDFEIVFEEAKMYGSIILIVDEIHRMNKDKQDLLLSYLESGLIILIGLTSTNPYYTINPAIRSRCQILELKELSEKDIIKGIKKVKTILSDFNIDDETTEYIANISSGDIRYTYNLIEFCYYSFGPNFDINKIREMNTKSNFFHDKNSDGHYDVLSAFQKSIRGSDVNAAVHYLARLIEGGDLESIYRRMLVIAYEDIGLANPMMGTKVLSAVNAAERLGLPELIIPLSNVVIEMALSPKSNSAYIAINEALNDIRSGNTGNVPNHIKTNSATYLYPHDYPPYYYVKQEYLPDNIKNRVYYIRKNNKYEYEMNEFDKKRKENKQAN